MVVIKSKILRVYGFIVFVDVVKVFVVNNKLLLGRNGMIIKFVFIKMMRNKIV